MQRLGIGSGTPKSDSILKIADEEKCIGLVFFADFWYACVVRVAGAIWPIGTDEEKHADDPSAERREPDGL